MNLKSLEKELILQIEKMKELHKKQLLGKLDNYYKIVQAKRNLARIKTHISMRKISS